MIPSLRSVFSNKDQFRPFYRFVFNYIKDPGHGVRLVDIETALGYLELVLLAWFGKKFFEGAGGKIFSWLKEKQESKEKKGMNKDEWNCLLDFLDLTNGGNVDGFEVSEENSWPTLID